MIVRVVDDDFSHENVRMDEVRFPSVVRTELYHVIFGPDWLVHF